MVKAEKLTKIYKLPGEDIVALKGIDFEINEGEFVSIMGPSGAGKTTLLNLIGCLDGVTGGKLKLMGHELSSLTEKQLSYLRRGNIGFVFQDFFLISSLTALENVKAALVFARIKDKDERAVQILERLGLGKRLHHYPEELSGGELQRVAIARALVISPKIILADEPTGNLDTKNALLIYEIFQQINREEKITIIAATHNVKLGYLANRVIHLVDGYIEKDERLR